MNEARTPVQVFMLVAGALMLLVGVAGFIGPWVEGAAAGGEGELFGFFAVNGALNAFNIAGGLIVMLSAASIPAAVWMSRLFAVVFGVLAIWGIALVGLAGTGNALLADLLHINVVNNWAYLAATALFAFFGFVPAMWGEAGEQRATVRAPSGRRAYR